MKTTRVSTIKKQPTHGFAISSYVPYQFALISRRLSETLECVYGKQHGLSRTEWRTLALLDERKQITAAELVLMSGMDAVAVHRAVKNLEKKGLVERTDSPTDKRAKYLSLTKTGKVIFIDVSPYAQALQKNMLSALSAEESSSLVVALEKLMRVDFSAIELDSSGGHVSGNPNPR